MPRIPFTDLASAPEFKSLPVEDQQKVSENYWNEVAAEQPDRAEFYGQMRDASKSLFDLKAKRADAAPVQRRFLDAQVQDLAFDLSLGDEMAQGRMTQEGYTEALKVRDTERAQRQAQLDKTRDLFSDDPKKQQALALRFEGLEQTAITGGVFGSTPLMQRVFGTADASKDAYAALREQTAKDYGLEPDEVDALVKPRLGMLDKPVSADPIGNPFIQPEILAQGPDAVKDAILKSELPWSEKKRLTEKDDLAERMDGYYKATVEGVQKNHPELYAILDLDQVQGDPKAAFSLIQASLNKGGFGKFAGGFAADTLSTAEQVAPMVAVDPVLNRRRPLPTVEGSPDLAAERRQEVKDTVAVSRRAQESINQLSQEFYKNQGQLWGVDASAYGSGAGSVLTAVGAGILTGGASIPVSSARVATMGPTALRMLNGANSVMRASPSIGLAMAKTGTSTYEQAIKSGKSEEEAGELATLAGATEGVITGVFSLVGAGGVEAVGEQLLGTAARQAVRESAKSGFRTFGEKMLKGIASEQFEEGMIAAFDSATVQARINPNMTVEDFQNTLRETALVTLAVSGPTIGVGSLRETLAEKATYQKTDEELELEANLNLADAVTTQPGQANIPPAGQGPANAAPNGGAVAPGAPTPVAPGGTQPVAPAQGATGAPAAVPGVQPVGAAEPVLVRSDAEVDSEMARRGLLPPNPMLTPEERQADLQNRAPDLAETATGSIDVQETPVGERQIELPVANEEQTGTVVGEPAAALAAELPSEGTAQREGQGPQEVAQNLVSSETPEDTKPHAAMLDEQGVPKRLFHGKAAPFKNSEFQIKPNQLTNLSGLGPAWFSTSRNQAERFVGETPEGPGEVVEPTRIDIRNPLVLRGNPESVAAVRENRKILDLMLKIGQVSNESISDEDFEILKQYLLERGVMSIKNKRTVDLQPWTGKVLVGDEAARVARKESSDLMQGTHPEADPFGQLKRLLKEAEITLSASGIDTQGMTEGEMLRRALELEGKDGIVLLGTMADTKVDDEPSDWVIPFRPDQLVFDTPAPATPAAETPAVEEAPAETFREPEPTNWSEVFEVLNDRDPATKQVDTESPKFKELVAELKNNRVAEAAGKLEQRKADIVELEQRIAKERKERNEKRKEQNRFRMKNKPLDEHQEKIKRLTGHGHGFTRGIKDWLVERGLDPKITINKTWREVALRERDANSKAKTERIQAQFDKLTPEAKEVVEAFHRMGKKPVEEKESLEFFWNTDVGKGIKEYGGLQSKKYFTDRGLPVPNEYNGLSERVPPHIGTAIFKNSDTVGSVDKVASAAGLTVNEFWSEFWDAVAGISKGKDATQDDYNERKQREAEDREIAFAEQQLKALENDVQIVDLREVRDGDKFTLGGVDYTATRIEADQRGQTQSFTLRGDGPLTGTEVTEDFFAESVTPTEGSLAHVDPAEIEAIRIAQEFPEDFEDVAEPAPTATEPAVEPEPESAAEPAAPAPTPAPAPAPQPQATTPPPPAEPTPPQTRPVQPGMAEVVSTQNAATDAWREANGFPPIFKNNPVTFTQYWQDAQKLLKQDPDAGKKLVARMKKELFQPDTTQVMLILNEMLMAKGAMERALYERNLQGESATADQIAAVNDALAYYAEMTLLNSRVGSIQATAFGARKVFVTDELDIGVIAGRIQHAQGGKKLSKEQSDELEAAYAKIKEFEEREKVREAEASEDNAQQVFENMVIPEFKKSLREGQKRGEKPLTTLQRKAQESREWLRQNIQGRANMNFLPAQEAYHVAVIGVSYIVDGASAIGAFTTRLVKDFGTRYLPFVGDIYKKSQELHQAVVPKAKKIKPRQEILDGIDPGEMVNGKAIYQLVRYYVNEGLQTFEEVMTAVHTDLRQSHPNLTMREVHDAFSNYGITTQPSQEKDAKTTRKYREMARYSSQLEDAMAKSYPKKTGPQRDPQEQEVRDLAKQVRDTIRKFNLRPKNDKEQLKSTFDAIKTRLKNEFEDYDTAVKKGEERKAREPQKFTAEEEAELKDLRQKRDDRKKDYEAIFKKKGLTTEQRIERMEALLDRRIEEERKMLEEGILKRDREMQMGPWTPALRKQQDTLNKLKADRRERQKAARPKKPEDLKDYERKLKSLEKRIKEEEDLLAAGLTARQKNFKMGRWTPQMAEMQARLDALRDDRRELAKKQAPKKSEEQTAYERSVRAIEAAIQRYNDIINAIKKPGKPTFSRTLDAEMKSLIDQRDALRDAADAVLEADPERKDKRKQDLLKVLNKSINEITRKIQDGDFSTKARKPGEFDADPDVVKIRKARDLLNKSLAAMRKVDPDAAKKQLREMIAKREAELSKGITLPDAEADPFAGDEEIKNLRTALDLLSDIKRIKTSTAKIQARLDAKDYTKSVKPTPKTSKAREDAIVEHNRLKSELNRMVIQTELDNRSFGQLVADRTNDLLFNVSRTLMTSADTGTIGRQTQLVAFTRPGVWVKSLPSHFAFAKKHAERVQARVENHPDYDVAVQAGMNLGSWQEGATFDQMNEEMRSEILRLIPGVGKVTGAVVDASIRAYVSGINSVRMPYFSLLYRTLIGERKGFSAKLTNKLGGVGLGTQKEIEYLARHVEIMTGRGNLGAAANSADFLSKLLFSPRYWLSRLQVIGHFPVMAVDLMTGFKLYPETRAARKVVAMEYARMAIGVAVYYNFLSMVKHLRGWDDDEMYIEEDPRSSDFRKVKIGNTRIDPMAGMLQNIVFVSRTGAWMLRGTEFGREAIDGDKIVGGKLISMRDAKQDKDTMASEVGRMIRSKLAPWPSAFWNMAAGEDAVGNKVRLETEILGLYLPLSQVEMYNAMQEHGANPGMVYSAINLLGWGVSTYGPGTKETTLEQDIMTGVLGIDQSRYDKDDAKKAPGWKIPKPKPLPTF